VRLSPFLQNGFIRFDLDVRVGPPEEDEYNEEKHLLDVKKAVIEEVARLIAQTGLVGNESKLFLDLWNREKKASTAVGHGIAIPHIRSKQVRGVVLGFIRSREGYDFGAPDGEKVHFFIIIVGSAFDSDLYLKVYRQVSQMFRFDGIREALFAAETEGEIYRLFDGKY
jgi:mannitol/fructose-specific phosphotransferase system IIA component (Ntr-type)